MLEIWFSLGYVLLLAIILFAFILRRTRGVFAAVTALLVGIPLWFAWEYARPTWTTGTIVGTQVRRTDPDPRGNTRDIQYIYMRNRADRGLEFVNEDSWWWLKRNSERVYNDAITADQRNTEVTVMWNRWRSTIFSWFPNVLALRPAGAWPYWSLRTLSFYSLSALLWLVYFSGFSWLPTRTKKIARGQIPDSDRALTR